MKLEEPVPTMRRRLSSLATLLGVGEAEARGILREMGARRVSKTLWDVPVLAFIEERRVRKACCDSDFSEGAIS